MSNYLDLVRYRNDGDDFHILWTARRALRLLDPTSKLVAVAVEGVSDKEAKTTAGLLVIDTTEYFGSQSLKKAERVAYCQLKYSTTAANTAWNVSGLKDTLKGFGERFAALRQKHSASILAQRVRFHFVTNRPIASSIWDALKGRSNPTLEKIRAASGLKPVEFKAFLPLLVLQGQEASRRQQYASLESEAGGLLGHVDVDACLRMKDLVHSKTLSEAKADNVIVRATVLHRLGFVEDDLLPSPPRMEKVASEIPRSQESEIVHAVLRADNPVVIHAAGGVGKSILAQRLLKGLPPGSESVIFDGFAAGAYRSPRDPRHLHSRGLVHIANTLSARGLCDVLLPAKGTARDAFVRAFRRRLAQAALVVKARSPKAIVLVVLDAADNSAIAADERREAAFVQDILHEAPPEGCRLVALARTERLDLLKLPASAIRVDLSPFTEAETAVHLRGKYLKATDDDVKRFHRLTDSNPRVQANALANSNTLPDLLASLGPRVRTVETLIKEQLESALTRVEREQGPSKDLQALCTALSILPPLVPVRTLALAAGVPSAAVRSFASDFAGGRPLWVYEGALQFRDEPVETWFRQRFPASPRTFSKIVEILEPKAATDGYIAAALPQLLLGAGKYSKLVDLALTGPPFGGDDAVEQREVILRRVRYALKAAISKNRLEDAAKLMIRAGEETASDDRQARFLTDNADLVARLAGSDTVFDFIFRKRAWELGDRGYAQCAIMLASDPHQRSEAGNFLQLAFQSLRDWANTPSESRQDIGKEHIADLTLAVLLIEGPRKAASFISGWTPRSLSFEIGRLVSKRILDAGGLAAVQAWLANAGRDLHLRLGITLELSRVHALPSSADVVATIKLLRRTKPNELAEERDSGAIACAIAAASEFAFRRKVRATHIKEVLEAHRPAHARPFDHWERDRRDAVLRNAALASVLSGTELGLDQITPSSLTGELTKKGSEFNEEAKKFKRSYSALIPWYKVRALAVAGRLRKRDAAGLLSAAERESLSDTSWSPDDRERTGVINDVPLLWLDSLRWAGLATEVNLKVLTKWLDQQSRVHTPTWTALARVASQNPSIPRAALSLAARAKDIILGEHADARQTSEGLASLARAVLSASQPEAAGYFQLALERLGRIGDEMHDRLFCLLTVAGAASQDRKPHSREAYRLARLAEVFEAHNDHKFPWHDVSEAVAALCSSSGFAITSRWHDRRQAWLGSILPPVICTLLERKQLSPPIGAALHIFPGYWGMRDSSALFFDGNLEKRQRQQILDLLVADLEFSEGRETSLAGLLSATTKFDLNIGRLRARHAFESAASRKGSSGSSVSFSLPKSGRREQKPNWRRLLQGLDLNSPAGITRAVARMRSQPAPWEWEALYLQIRQRIKPKSWASHVHALGASALEFWQALDMLEGAVGAWKSSEAVRRAVSEEIKVIVQQHPLGLARGRWVSSRDLGRCARLSGLSERDLLSRLTGALADHVDSVAAASWFHLAGEVARVSLRPSESLRVLTYSLDRLDPILREEDGDGDWRANLVPPKKSAHAVAGFLFSILCSPKPEERWIAVHAVRRLCAVGQREIVAALIELMRAEELPAFTDRRFPLYYRHGRLYLLIAMARVAEENPSFLRNYFSVFLRLALHDEPHVLMRHFAAIAAVAIANKHSSACPAGTLAQLREVNESPFPRRAPKPGQKVGWRTDVWKARGFHFGYDFDRYWLGPLAETFNQSTAQVANLVGKWIVDKWGEKYRGAWKEDPRARLGQFKSFSTEPDHGSYPSADRLTFYLSYHASFCAAGELLAKRAITTEDSWRGDRWSAWLEGHLLTRPDGRWVADRRDFEPLERARWQKDPREQNSKDWRWSILPVDFDQALGINKPVPQEIVAWGRWNRTEGYRSEDVRISTALVSQKSSLSLLRALQNIDCFHDYRVPPERDSLQISAGQFELKGWIASPDGTESGLDKFDGRSGDIRWPVPRPGRLVRRLWRLRSDDEQRIWQYGNRSVMRTTVWGCRRDDGDKEGGNDGTHMSVDLKFLLAVLARLQRDLIIEVEVKRDDGTKEEKSTEYYRHQFYTRLYILRSDGSLHTTSGCRRLRSGVGSRA
ncbi:MAG: hypothetical protein HY921_03310 [Elusimicrobia bacterium]|nr:hypothetical protein [Elusimicrobiota bacterium]